MKYIRQASTNESHKLFKIFDNGFVKCSHFPAYVISCRSSSSTQEYIKGTIKVVNALTFSYFKNIYIYTRV